MVRRITTAITLLVLCGILAAGAVYGWNQLFAEVQDPGATATAEPSPTCTTETVAPGQRLRTRQVRVSVFNAGTVSGMAGETLTALTRRGFLTGEDGNAPEDIAVEKAQVWTTVRNDPEARLVARQFGKKVKIVVSERDLGPGIDVLVGSQLDGLAKKAPRSIKVDTRQSICLPNASGSPSPETNA